MGDFNYKDINWQTHQASEPIAQKFLDCLEDIFLTQHVTQPTRDNSVLDLVITDEPGMIDHVGVYGHFSTSDHNILYWTTNVVVARATVKTNVVRNYNKPDVDSIKKDLRDANWELDSGKSFNQLWTVYKNHIEAAIHRHVPVKKLNAGKQKKVLWMTTKAVRAVRRKQIVLQIQRQ